MKLTTKQREILKTLFDHGSLEHVPAENQIDLDQLLGVVTYEVNKPAIQFSLRALKTKGLLKKSGYQKRRGSNRVLWVVTKSGVQYLTGENPA